MSGLLILQLALGHTRCAYQKPLPWQKVDEQDATPRGHGAGRVLKVNSDQRYVILECALLPRAGEEARVFREETRVGRIRFARQISFPYAAADILEGEIAPGDRVRK